LGASIRLNEITTPIIIPSHEEDDNNRDYESEHMRLVKHTPSAQEKGERHTREAMNKLNNSIIDLDDDITILIDEVKELKEAIKNISGTMLKKSAE
jgi:hypothetical protein